ncbi:uncharacterized protein TRIADDRAFT_59656 [Trichoplax adhaerens]|uniref:DUF3719 domain-containing protein n=1 Tax=Trichoplax adhaerens TaxID=10228 RepID=B3S629_TRIAD|nr:predicted protein [Trichoplax adhaerens]EDV21688.1 predicted protein [Trichoplax adhaerens]|eukprot:XP_002115836.1 predicted protein [Trichoplax adhaerens]
MDYTYQREEPLEIRGVSHFSSSKLQSFPNEVKPSKHLQHLDSIEPVKEREFFVNDATACSVTGSFRSSIYSVGWGSNEYEKDAASAVQQLFSDFESSLYGEAACKADVDLNKIKLRDLHVLGHHVDLASGDEQININSGAEIFASDGEVQEYLAYDSWETDAKELLRRSRHGIPPVTPDACAQDSIISHIMNCIWSDIVIWLRDLFSILHERSSENGGCTPVSRIHSYSSVKRKLVATEGIGYEPATPMLKSYNHAMHQGRLRTGIAMSLSNNSVSTDYETLQGVMTIRSLAPRRRATTASAVAYDARLRTPLLQHRPDSSQYSNISNGKTKTGVGYTPVTVSRLASAKPPRKLSPIEQAKTPPNNSNVLSSSVSISGIIRGNKVGQYYHNIGSGSRHVAVLPNNSISSVANSKDTNSTVSAFWNLKSVALPPIEKITERNNIPTSSIKLNTKNSDFGTVKSESTEELRKSFVSGKHLAHDSRPSSTHSTKPFGELKSPGTNNKRLSLTHQKPVINGIIGTSMGINLLYRLERKESAESDEHKSDNL